MGDQAEMIENPRFVHVNLIARDWQALARFYETVFGCQRLPPERDLSGPWLEASTGVSNAHLRGVHLRLPGNGEDGPTLEIFQYDDHLDGGHPAANRLGWGHIALAVEDVAAAREAVIAAGGGTLGETVSLDVPGAGTVTFVYAADPEGNLIELQSWA
jgi:catechol 2,3-dioxygenase-like lactoylglutathione lyase family enzyme